jgi:hypothetical protein
MERKEVKVKVGRLSVNSGERGWCGWWAHVEIEIKRGSRVLSVLLTISEYARLRWLSLPVLIIAFHLPKLPIHRRLRRCENAIHPQVAISTATDVQPGRSNLSLHNALAHHSYWAWAGLKLPIFVQAQLAWSPRPNRTDGRVRRMYRRTRSERPVTRISERHTAACCWYRRLDVFKSIPECLLLLSFGSMSYRYVELCNQDSTTHAALGLRLVNTVPSKDLRM